LKNKHQHNNQHSSRKMVEFTVFKGGKSGIHQETSHREVGPRDVLVKITHSGLCGTDIHYKGQDMVLGHEGAGTVQDLGKDVTQFKKGDRVGWGYLHDSCGHCKQCLRGTETFCPERKMYGEADLDQGSMASHAVWKDDYLFKIPDEISSENAAPLMCGGATVFNAMQFYGVKSTDRVGVLGVGGLGHLAIQFAAAMGCEVVVFSGTDSKKEEATQLGAKEFVATKGQKELKLSKPLDHLLVTSASQPDWNLYLPIMAPGGTIYPLTVSADDLKMPYMGIILSGLKIQGSLVAAREIHREMLEFAAAHNISPIIQKFPLSKQGVEEAFKTLEDGQMRYRGVLVA
jgi:D-arabinose 1-dehydrogenase-like Zn-dependent alcohol dehydrogenase